MEFKYRDTVFNKRLGRIGTVLLAEAGNLSMLVKSTVFDEPKKGGPLDIPVNTSWMKHECELALADTVDDHLVIRAGAKKPQPQNPTTTMRIVRNLDGRIGEVIQDCQRELGANHIHVRTNDPNNEGRTVTEQWHVEDFTDEVESATTQQDEAAQIGAELHEMLDFVFGSMLGGMFDNFRVKRLRIDPMTIMISQQSKLLIFVSAENSLVARVAIGGKVGLISIKDLVTNFRVLNTNFVGSDYTVEEVGNEIQKSITSALDKVKALKPKDRSEKKEFSFSSQYSSGFPIIIYRKKKGEMPEFIWKGKKLDKVDIARLHDLAAMEIAGEVVALDTIKIGNVIGSTHAIRQAVEQYAKWMGEYNGG